MEFLKSYIGVLAICMFHTLNAQETMKDEVPYAAIPDAPDAYSAGAVISRMIDGLGFRYYWATEGLSDENFAFRTNETGRSIFETMEHVYDLSVLILNSAKKASNDLRSENEKPSKDELRATTLINLKTASDLFRFSEDLSEHKIIYQREKGVTEFPFWYQINGPIEDAVWHAGQIAIIRRAAGNPFNDKVSLFRGKLKE